ncbi:DUF4007 family protein [Halorhodospira sp. 9621]|uniref:DUF4007 family protein n=1 Tax=Halorhodospira sp. 9621 TaxID=2899135 RepID=UPI001EE80170|nr:DUF4007 family protein [Halorhodospira sp. 9621]MCG5534252.1 DUF4007 family protein [Halorhodospira sp. 9621]
MRFGGHETFPVREGWIYKGLSLIAGDPEGFNQPYVADELGVGRNMAKSIRFWLLATGLAITEPSDRTPKRKQLTLTRFGEAVYKSDRYCLQLGTWAALHVNMLNHGGYAKAWNWFFNRFTEQRFDRLTASAAFERYVQRHERRSPAPKTLQRDVACLLSCYATPIPSELADPEDASDSPLRRLGLLTLFRDSNVYRRNEPNIVELPPELIGYAFAQSGAKEASLPLREACFYDGGPGRAFQLSLNGFLDWIEQAEELLSSVRVVGSAGERRIQLDPLEPVEWLKSYYARVGALSTAA